MEPLSMSGRVALVTGASKGIGKVVAGLLAQAGATVIATSRSGDLLAGVAARSEGRVVAVQADLTDPRQIDALVGRVSADYGRLDVLVINAGVFLQARLADSDLAEIDSLVTTNLSSAIQLVRRLLPIMSTPGDILFTNSISGHQVLSDQPVYTATKHALLAFAQALRNQLIDRDIRVGSIAPGTVLTELWGYQSEEQIADGVRAGAGIRAEDVAEIMMFMLTRPRHVVIRDVVVLPSAQEI